MKKVYVITKVNKFFKGGARVTTEKTIGHTEDINEIIALAKRQKADIDEVLDELKEYGITHFKGYMIDEMLV